MALENINVVDATAFERRAWGLTAIYLGYLLVSMLVMAAVINFLGG